MFSSYNKWAESVIFCLSYSQSIRSYLNKYMVCTIAPKMFTCHFEATLDFSPLRIYLPIIIYVKSVTAVKFHYRVLQLTAVFLTI